MMRVREEVGARAITGRIRDLRDELAVIKAVAAAV